VVQNNLKQLFMELLISKWEEATVLKICSVPGQYSQLSIPRIVAPFRFNSSSEFVPRTNISLGYEFQNRTQYYTLNNFNASFGYSWKENARKEHELKVFDATYVSPTNVTAEYEALAKQILN
jgi:hypothetical protein